MLGLRFPQLYPARTINLCNDSGKLNSLVVCGARGPRPRYPRVWKSRKRIGTISKSQKLVTCIKGLSNVKEEVYGALDSFVAWDLEFPLIVVKKALKTLEDEKEWKRIIQVIKWMLSKGQGKTMGSYYTLLNALAEDGRLDEAEELWTKIFSRNLECLPRVFFGKMISIYYKHQMYEKMFEVFADMEELGVSPDKRVVDLMGNTFQKLGMLDKYEKLHEKYPPPKWEYRYIKGKRVRIKMKNLIGSYGEESEYNPLNQDAESSSGQYDLQKTQHQGVGIKVEHLTDSDEEQDLIHSGEEPEHNPLDHDAESFSDQDENGTSNGLRMRSKMNTKYNFKPTTSNLTLQIHRDEHHCASVLLFHGKPVFYLNPCCTLITFQCFWLKIINLQEAYIRKS
ncbi:Tetratricopeptide-like helical domain-containing protein [Dioscorea alata]|uniref:Tetratricopeptide-like helical domain-containing protein n=1 Tax=Dioscorea alata TaxID=55571 RepID=A0ACB7WI04_DIOAL|nr:Tetratricopeptide-like helical domain-containing protein [Dioscorea alata]